MTLMTPAEIAGLCMCMLFFALGGLVGSMRTMYRLMGMDHLRLPWRTRLRFYHFFGSDRILIKRAEQSDRDAREVYGAILMDVLHDLGWSGPWPQSRKDWGKILAEAESRFQAEVNDE